MENFVSSMSNIGSESISSSSSESSASPHQQFDRIRYDLNREKYEDPISFESMINARSYVLPCGHSFGESIINEIATKAIQSCPTCREEIKVNVSRNYLLEQSLEDIDLLDNSNKSLVNNNKALREENAHLKREIVVLRGENTQLKAELKKSQEIVAQLSDKVDTFASMLHNQSKKNEEDKKFYRNQNEELIRTIHAQSMENKELMRRLSPSESSGSIQPQPSALENDRNIQRKPVPRFEIINGVGYTILTESPWIDGLQLVEQEAQIDTVLRCISTNAKRFIGLFGYK